MSLSTASCPQSWDGGDGRDWSVVEASPHCKVSSLGVKEAAVALSLAAHRFFLVRGFATLDLFKGGKLNKSYTGKGYIQAVCNLLRLPKKESNHNT